MRMTLCCSAVVMLVAAATSPVTAQPAPIEVRVDAAARGAKIDRNVFGQFAEHLGFGIYPGVWVGRDSPIPNTRGIRNDVVAALKAIRVPNVRWPGGCFADEYHWRDGIGAPARRPSAVHLQWGGARETNAFGTDEFMDFIGQIGAEAYISLNIGSGTVEEAARWMDYLTADPSTSAGKERAANGHPAPYRVRFVGLGNESWGCGGGMRPEHYLDLMKRFARFARNRNPSQQDDGPDPMQRIAVGPGGDDTAYTEAVMQAWSKRDWSWNIAGLSLHQYTTGGWPPSYASTGFDRLAYARFLKATLAMEGIVTRHTAIMDRYDPGKKVALVVDEWGSWLAPLPGTNPLFYQQQNSLRDAILAALNLNIFARHADRVRMTSIAQMTNVLQAMVMTRGDRMVLTPTYHLYRMYLPFQDATVVPTAFAAGTVRIGDVTLPRLDAVAARDSGGKLWLAITNVDPDQPARVTLRGGYSAARGQVLTAPRVDSVNSFDAPEQVRPRSFSAAARAGALNITVPAKSVTVVQIG